MDWDCHVHVFGPAGRYPLASRLAYAPPVRTLEMLEAAAATSGVTRFVIVQPSVYGTDNSCMLDALRSRDGRDRGIAVVAPEVSERDLQDLHALGVRGVRFNLVSRAGNGLEGFDEIARKCAPLGWHIQFLATPGHHADLAALRARTAVPFVLDHMAGGDSPHLHRLLDREDVWVKLSGFYRLSGGAASWSDLDPLAAKVATLAPGRLLWGSDWPHTWFFERGHGASPGYGMTQAPLARMLAEGTRRRVLLDSPAEFYR